MPATVELSGSRRDAPEGARQAGDVDGHEPLTVTVHLKSPARTEYAPGSAADLADLHRTTTRHDLAIARNQEYAPAVTNFRTFADIHGLTLHDVDLPHHRLRITGTVAQLSAAFGTHVGVYEADGRQFRARAGMLHIADDLAPWTRAVLGFDTRPQVKRPLRPLVNAGDGLGLWPRDIARLYGIPSDQDGAGQCVGVIALGGGYLTSDLTTLAQQTGQPDRKSVV